MIEYSDDVCYIDEEGHQFETLQEYNDFINYCNNEIIKINNVKTKYPPEDIIHAFNYLYIEDIECIFCRYKVEKDFPPGHDLITLYGTNDIIEDNIFSDMAKFAYNQSKKGFNCDVYLKVIKTSFKEARRFSKNKWKGINDKYIEQNSYFEDDVVYKLSFRYYEVYDFLKEKITEHYNLQKKYAYDSLASCIIDEMRL